MPTGRTVKNQKLKVKGKNWHENGFKNDKRDVIQQKRESGTGPLRLRLGNYSSLETSTYGCEPGLSLYFCQPRSKATRRLELVLRHAKNVAAIEGKAIK